MEDVARGAIDILRYLTPGFLAAWVFYGFTTHPRPSQFERVVQALIFTVIIEGLVLALRNVLLVAGEFWSVGAWNEGVSLFWSAVSALLVGLLVSHATNNDYVHGIARYLGITGRTSFSSNWLSAFQSHATYVVLHLEGERRLYGWPMEWPDDPGMGHFIIKQASWLNDDGSQIDLAGVDSILISVKEVVRVEFMKAPISK